MIIYWLKKEKPKICDTTKINKEVLGKMRQRLRSLLEKNDKKHEKNIIS